MIKWAHWEDAVGDPKWVWPNFHPKEIACKGTGRLEVDPEAMDKLQALRESLGKPILVTSGYRSPSHNAKVGGASQSQHLKGRAFDCMMTNHAPQDFAARAKQVGFTGFGWYPKHNFIHVDTGPERSWGTPWSTDAFEDEGRKKQGDGVAAGGGIAAGAAAAAGVIAENSEAVIESATAPGVHKLMELVPYGLAALAVIVAIALIFRFWKQKKEEKPE